MCTSASEEIREERQNEDRLGKTDESNRTKILHRQRVTYSICLCLAYLTCGWNLAQIGSALLDLQQIASVTLEQSSLYQTFFNVGYFAGSLLCAIIYKRINKFIFLFLSLLLVAVALAVIPWCHVHGAMVTAHFFVGLSGGIIDSVVNAEMLSVWGPGGLTYMQAMHFSYAFGGFISPVITAQFLAPTQHHHDNTSPFSNISTIHNYVNATFSGRGVHTYDVIENVPNMLTSDNATTTILNGSTVSANFNDSTRNDFRISMNSTRNASDIIVPFYLTSRVYISYSISACICGLIGLPYLVMFFTFDLEKIRSGRPSKEERSTPNLTKSRKMIVLINMGIMAGIYVAIEESFSGFLNAFCVNRLDWSSSQGSYATSVFYGCFGFGRLIAVIWVKYINPKKILSIFCIFVMLLFTSMLISGTYYLHTGVWVTSALTGLAIAVIYPTVFTWTEEDFLPVSGKVSSYFNITSALGGTINPIVIGTLMDKYSSLWYTYLLLGESLILFLTYIGGVVLSRKVQSHKEKLKSRPEELEMNTQFVS